MKTKLLFSFIGFFVGIIFSIISAYMFVFYAMNNYNDETTIKNEARFSTESSANLDNSECPNYPYNALIGKWEGETELDENREKRKWIVNRSSDGKYKIDFEYISGDDTRHSYEEGYWAYSGCLYSVIVNSVDGQNALYQEVYRVHTLNDIKMEYTNFRTGSSYTIMKVL